MASVIYDNTTLHYPGTERPAVTDLDLTIGDGEFLVRNLYLSLDPYMRGRMDEAKSYAKPVAVGEVMGGGAVGSGGLSMGHHPGVGDVVSGPERLGDREQHHLLGVGQIGSGILGLVGDLLQHISDLVDVVGQHPCGKQSGDTPAEDDGTPGEPARGDRTRCAAEAAEDPRGLGRGHQTLRTGRIGVFGEQGAGGAGRMRIPGVYEPARW